MRISPSLTRWQLYKGNLLTRPPLLTLRLWRGKLEGRTFEPGNLPESIFVLSTGRCGTQTLASLLDLSEKIIAFHEPHPRLDRLAKVVYEAPEPDRAIIVETLTVARQMLLQAAAAAQKIYVETGHFNTFLAPFISDLLPNAKFIHLVRHPYSFAMSATRRQWYAGSPFDAGRIVPAPDSDAGQAWASYSVFQKNVWHWTETNRWAMDFMTTLPAHQRLQVRAEDIFQGNLDAIRQLYTFAGVDAPSEHRIGRVIGQRLNKGEAGSEANVDGMLPDGLRKISGEIAEQLGYNLMSDIHPVAEGT